MNWGRNYLARYCYYQLQLFNMEFDNVLDFKSLYKGLRLSQKSVLWKDSVAGYSLNGLKNTYKLKMSVQENTYRLSPYHRFTIKEPKARDILATHISDRQFQRSLCDNILTPQIAKSFIRDNVACLKGHGVDDGVKRLKTFLHRYYRQYGNKGYVLQCDVKGFFPNTDFKVAQDKILKSVDNTHAAARACEIIESFCEATIMDELMELGVEENAAHTTAHYISNMRCKILITHLLDSENAKIISQCKQKIRRRILTLLPDVQDEFINHVTNDTYKGIGLGSQASQLTELLMLNDLDHYVKEKLHIKYYVRYMDDFVLIHPDKEYLKQCLIKIREIVENNKLQLNQKTRIYELRQGIVFLKWKYILTDSGKVLLRMKKKKITKQRRKLRKLKNLLDNKQMTIEDIRDSFRSWQSCAEKGNTYSVIKRMREYYKELFKEEAPYGSRYFKK